MKKFIVLVLWALVLSGCGGVQGELNDRLVELKKTVVTKDTTASEAYDLLKEANDFVNEVQETQTEEGEKYPEVMKGAKALREERIRELRDVTIGGTKEELAKLKAQAVSWLKDLNGGKEINLDMEGIKNFFSPSPEQEERLGKMPEKPRSDKLSDWTKQPEPTKPTKTEEKKGKN